MNNTSPLIPQGAIPPRAKSSLYFKVLMILSIHVVVIGGMLLQGCEKTQSQTKTDGYSSATNDTSAPIAGTATDPATLPQPVNPNLSNTVAGPIVTPTPNTLAPTTTFVPAAKPTDLAPPPAPGETKEYVIMKGDTLGAIARKNGLSVKALMAANPGVDAKKLQVDHKLQIPAGTAASATTTVAGGATVDAAPTDGAVYLVKTGDTLSKIAKSHGTTFKKIMAMNDLKTTSIRAGQKLKLPAAKAAAEPTATPAAAPAPASASLTMPTTVPMRVSAAAPATTSPVAAN